MRILNLPFILFIKFYKYFFSPFFVNSCRFDPSCSTYALECFKKYNILKAIYKSSIRILKCNPWFNVSVENSIEKENK